MAKADVTVFTDKDLNFYAQIEFKVKYILDTMKHYYQRENRQLLKAILESYFNTKESKEFWKPYIEKELKAKFGIDEEVYGMKVERVDLQNEKVYVYYRFQTRKKKKQPKKYEDIIL